MQGNLNVSVYQFSFPLNFSFSNQGSNLGYDIPFDFNRLSLKPKYKWIQAYIGDAMMSFSPYTLNAHQFTGLGLELTPPGSFHFSIMSGRLLKAVEDNSDPRTIPAFQRNGHSGKVEYKKDKFSIGLIGFYAKDHINSLTAFPDEKGITPKENMAIHINGSVKATPNLELRLGYANTAITHDLRADNADQKEGIAALFLKPKNSTEYYKAIKMEMNYQLGKSGLGLGYERIDPGYETLGAYYFNNDFENITANFTTVLFDKVNLSVNIGYQRDDLENVKESATGRSVGALNLGYSFSERLNFTASYSSFSTFTNNRLNQFDNINDDNLLDDQQQMLDYKQLSQNGNLSFSYILSEKESASQNLNFNYALAVTSNEEGGIVRIGGASTFHNLSTTYNLGLPKKKMNFSSALNVSQNSIGDENTITWGPLVNLNMKLFKETLNTSISTSYNSTELQVGSLNVATVRANTTFNFRKKHNFNLNAVQLFRSGIQVTNRELTFTFGYNYSF